MCKNMKELQTVSEKIFELEQKRKIYGRQIENIHRRREKVSGKES